MNREQQISPTIQEQIETIHANYKKEYCLHPKAGLLCNGDIVKAHTIQRNGGLSRIAQGGSVYTFSPKQVTFLKSGDFAARLVSIKSASTFTGFCSYHDNEIFTPIEKNRFLGNEEHTFLLGYRAICKELFGKRAQLELIPFFRNLDKGKSLEEQIQWQDFLDGWEIGVNNGMKWLQHHKSIYDTGLICSDYSNVRYYVLKIDKTPDFMCSGAILPEYDFAGNRLQNLLAQDQIHNPIAFSIIATNVGGAIVFSWIGNNDVCIKLVKSLDLLTDSQIPHAIVRLTFEYFWNVFASPTWWNSLDSVIRDKLLKRQREGGASRTTLPVPNCLEDDGVRAVTWTIVSRDTNIESKL